MYKFISAISLLIASSSVSATVIDFDDVLHGTVMSSQYVADGLFISAYEDGALLSNGPKAFDK